MLFLEEKRFARGPGGGLYSSTRWTAMQYTCIRGQYTGTRLCGYSYTGTVTRVVLARVTVPV